jgi:para-nitrobenzyl esterase
VAQDPNVVQTTDGPVRGYTEGGMRIWSAIPYAAPPVGNNRFKPPQPVTPWTEVKDCYYEGNICPQIDIDGIQLLGEEDCLYLDIYAPETLPAKPLPVMVWIYGGGWTLGDKYEFGLYNPTSWIQKQPHIHVAMNYRLAVFGFLALDELMKESGTTGNYGLQDQSAVLIWVQKNIKGFGGDPNSVTIFGESAGGFSVCWHLVNPMSAGLFHAAIMESGTCDSKSFFVDLPTAEQFSTDYAGKLFFLLLFSQLF